jgi:O-Antigen ligase
MTSAVARAGSFIGNAETRPRIDNWAKLTMFLVVGYLYTGRSFAYLGFPWISLYVGEMALAYFLLFGPRMQELKWLRIAWRLNPLKRFKRLLVLLLCYGLFESLRGMLSGYSRFAALRDTAFNYYPLFLFLGVWVGLRDRNSLRRTVRILAWFNGIYGVAYALFLSQLPWTMPGTGSAASDVPLFSEPLGSAIALLGLLAFEPKLKRVWHVLTLNAIVMLFVQLRSEWVGFGLGLLVFVWWTNQVKRFVYAAALLVLLIGLMYLGNVNLPSPKGRGGQISVNGMVARAVAPINKEAAAEIAPPEDVVGYWGNVNWRLVWWASIWLAVHANPVRALFGFGYGYPIGDLNPFIVPGTFIQTPHNDFFYALAFSGWLGVLLFLLLQVELVRLLSLSCRITNQPFALMCWIALTTESMFGDFFEAPMGAIPFFLLMGMAIAPVLLSGNGRASSAHAPKSAKLASGAAMQTREGECPA